MSMLAALARAYERMADRRDANGNPEVPPFGYSTEKIGFVISLNEDGTPAGVPIDLYTVEGKKRIARELSVPTSFKRPGTVPRPFFLWDTCAFVLGIGADDDDDEEEETNSSSAKLAAKLAAFKNKHTDFLRNCEDVGIQAFLQFLDWWTPQKFPQLGWPPELLTSKIVFAVDSERKSQLLHDRPIARKVWLEIADKWKAVPGKDSRAAICLITGHKSEIARTHPPIRGIRPQGSSKDADSIVSFNRDAFESYGHEQGDNAPVSEAAAFAYTTALNKFLATGSRNRIQIGDASTVFWADASNAEIADAADMAEEIFAAFFEVDESVQAGKVGIILEKIRQGRPLEDFAPDLAKGVRFHVLGLAPNAARLSIRFWFEDDFGQLARNYQRFVEDMRIEPPPRTPNPPLWRYLVETAVQGKRENVPPNLAGEWMRAILSGARYPLTLLSTVLMRIRAGGSLNPLRVAMLKAVINCYAQNSERKITVALDPDNKDPAYLLGRLFAVLEKFQTLALGKVNATIRDRYFGSASATPRTVFPILIRMSQHHRGKAEKGNKPRLAGYFAGQMSEIMNLLPPDLPGTLPLREQGKFALGYFHQMNRRKDAEIAPEELTEEGAAA